MEGNLEDKRIIVQGLGNIGYHAAKFLEEEDGAIVNGKGLSIQRLYEHLREHGGVTGFPGTPARFTRCQADHVRGSGHAPFVEEPAPFARAVERFLNNGIGGPRCPAGSSPP